MSELSEIEGLTEEQLKKITEHVSGLSDKNQELIRERRADAERVTASETALEEARKAALSAEERRLLAEGKYEEAQKLREAERAELVAKANQEAEKSKGALESMYRGTALNQAKSLIHDDYKDFTEARLEKMIHLEYDESGAAKTVYKDGDKVIANNVDEFKSWASEQPTWQKVLNGVNSSGAGVTKSNGGAMQGNTTESALNARLRASGII